MKMAEWMRAASIGFPSGRVKLTLWEGTEDEQSFPVRFPKNGRPYVKAFGIKYELTDREVEEVAQLKRVQGSLQKAHKAATQGG